MDVYQQNPMSGRRCGPSPDVPRKQLNALSDAAHRERQSASQSWRGDLQSWDLRKTFWTPLTSRAYVNYVGKCGNMWENLETCENMSERAVIYGIL